MTYTRYLSPYEVGRAMLVNNGSFNRADIGYDIIICHQASNTVGYGATLDPRMDIISPRVWQQPSSGSYVNKIIPAADPLSHYDIQANKIGAVVGFAIRVTKHLPLNRDILIMPCAMSNTGYGDATWAPGGTNYTDVVNRTNAIITTYPNSRVLTFFSYLHGGNDPAFWAGSNTAYKNAAKAQIDGFRAAIKTASKAPFIICGYTDASASGSADRAAINTYIATGLVNERSRVLWVSPSGLTAEADNVHLTADSQRVMSERIYQAFKAKYL